VSFFGKNLRFLRQTRQLSESDFALQLHIWEDTLKRFEREKAEPDLDTLVTIAEALGMPIDHLLKRDLQLIHQRISKRRIRLILMDVDGTLTDGRMYYTESGEQMKAFNTKDGMIISRLIKRKGLQFGLISSGMTESLLRHRAETLGIQHVYTGPRPKVEVINEWSIQLGIKLEQMAFIGDDVNDLGLMKHVGISACPADAVPQIRGVVDMILTRKGGEGCVREFLEEVLGFDVA